jgi:hypothetical protein
LEAVEFFFIGLVTPFEFSIEAMGDPEALAEGGEEVGFDGATEGSLRAGGIPLGGDGIVVGLDSSDPEGEGGEDILDEGLVDMIGHSYCHSNFAGSWTQYVETDRGLAVSVLTSQLVTFFPHNITIEYLQKTDFFFWVGDADDALEMD